MEYLIWLHHKISSLGYSTNTPVKLSIRIAKEGRIRRVLRLKTYSFSS
jgi:hypothetical protein